MLHVSNWRCDIELLHIVMMLLKNKCDFELVFCKPDTAQKWGSCTVRECRLHSHRICKLEITFHIHYLWCKCDRWVLELKHVSYSIIFIYAFLQKTFTFFILSPYRRTSWESIVEVEVASRFRIQIRNSNIKTYMYAS